jgi:Zn-finger nucleic acid-binding protein
MRRARGRAGNGHVNAGRRRYRWQIYTKVLMTSQHTVNCPACHRALTRFTISGVTVDVCQDGCAGIWFDQGELRSFDGPSEEAGKALLGLISTPRVSVDVSQRRRCPKCPDSVLMRHFFSAKRAVMVDECPTCAGIWLDSGELQQIRTEYGSEGARKQAAQLCLEEILVGDRMNLMRREMNDQLPYDTSRSRMISSLLVAFYLVVAFKSAGAAAAMTKLYVCIVPWACVCFPEVFGAAISPVLGTARQSSRSFVWFFGWLVLLLPLIQVLIVFTETIGGLSPAR